MSNFQKIVYNVLFKKSSSYVAFVVAGAIAAEFAIDQGIEAAWDFHNKGVCTSFIFYKNIRNY